MRTYCASPVRPSRGATRMLMRRLPIHTASLHASCNWKLKCSSS